MGEYEVFRQGYRIIALVWRCVVGSPWSSVLAVAV